MVKTKTRSKNSSSVLTRSGRSAAGACPFCDVTSVPAAAELGAFRHRVRGGPRGGQVWTRADGVEHPAARGHQVGATASRARVQQVALGAGGEFPERDHVALRRA